MPYCTEADIRNQSPFKDTTNISSAYITQKIAEATDLINSTIGGAYQLPLSSTPDIIANLAKEITTLIIYREQDKNIEVQPGLEIEKAWKIQMDTLLAIAKRQIKLFDSSTGVEFSLTSAATVYGYPNAASSDASASNNTAPRFTMAQSSIMGRNQSF